MFVFFVTAAQLYTGPLRKKVTQKTGAGSTNEVDVLRIYLTKKIYHTDFQSKVSTKYNLFFNYYFRHGTRTMEKEEKALKIIDTKG